MTFTAKYYGICGVCDEPIRPEDECAYSDDVIVHAECPVQREPQPVCDRCFMETAVNGLCGCDQ